MKSSIASLSAFLMKAISTTAVVFVMFWALPLFFHVAWMRPNGTMLCWVVPISPVRTPSHLYLLLSHWVLHFISASHRLLPYPCLCIRHMRLETTICPSGRRIIRSGSLISVPIFRIRSFRAVDGQFLYFSVDVISLSCSVVLIWRPMEDFQL